MPKDEKAKKATTTRKKAAVKKTVNKKTVAAKKTTATKKAVVKKAAPKKAAVKKTVAKKPAVRARAKAPARRTTLTRTPIGKRTIPAPILAKNIKKRNGKVGKTLKKIFKIFLVFFVLGVVGIIATVAIIIKDLPDIHDLDNYFTAQSTQILDREGNILYTIHGDENRENIEIYDRTTGEIKPEYQNIVEATLAIEDDDFYNHDGFDITGIAMAACHQAIGDAGGICPQRGGSTITQQYVKMAFLSSEKTIVRKIKELILSIRIEDEMTKNQIIELYLNKIPYGNNAYGIQSAAKTYFDKNASELTLAESAILASLPNAPTRYNPYGNGRDRLMGYMDETVVNPETGELGVYEIGRKDLVLKRMLALGWITKEEKDGAWAEANTIEFTRYREDINSPHFVFYIKGLLEEKYGTDVVETGGLKVYTTLDPNLQKFAEEALYNSKERISYSGVNNAALLSADVKSGQILAMVGSVDYWDEEIDGNVNVALRTRMPGSSFKPYAYANAFQSNYGAGTILYDVETEFEAGYKPQNYEGNFNGPVSARYALNYSLNIPALKLGILGGIDNLLNTVKQMGIESLDLRPRSDYGASLALGAGEITLFENVQGYSVFANGGEHIPLNALIKVEDHNGNILYEYESPEPTEVLDPQVAYEINNILSDPAVRPSWSTAIRIPGQVSALKTGTSNKKDNNNQNVPSDTWLMGYTPRVVTGVWAGNTDGSALGYNATGATVAGPLWKSFMIEATKNDPWTEFDKPAGPKWVSTSKLSGGIAADTTPAEYIQEELYSSWAIPTDVDTSVQSIEVEKTSGLLPTEDCTPAVLEYREFYNLHSLRPDYPNWEKGVQEWAEENNMSEAAPTQYTTLCDSRYSDIRQEKPEIQIIAPTNRGIVAPGKVGVVVNVKSPSGVDRVEYYLDDELKQTVRSYPYKGTLDIPMKHELGERHNIKAVVYDSFLTTGSSEIDVQTGLDRTDPVINITSPKPNAKIKNNSTVTIATTAYDTQSDLESVQFYIDDTYLGEVISSPYSFSFGIDTSTGDHTIKAITSDVNGNSSSDSVKIEVIKNNSEDKTWEYGDTPAVLLEPRDGMKWAVNLPATFAVQINPSTDAVKAEVIGIRNFEPAGVKNKQTVYGTISPIPDNNYFTLPWVDTALGDYEIFVKVYLENGEVRFSQRSNITVE